MRVIKSLLFRRYSGYNEVLCSWVGGWGGLEVHDQGDPGKGRQEGGDKRWGSYGSKDYMPDIEIIKLCKNHWSLMPS
jgi:hypothetical protein